jgi:hypothetical protein
MVTEFSAGITVGAFTGGIAAGPDGNLWFTEYGANGNRIGRITPAGMVTEFDSGITAGAQLAYITAGPDGNLWFTEQAGRIARITPSGVVTEFSSGISAGANPVGVTAGPDGNVWFAEYGVSRIGRIALSPNLLSALSRRSHAAAGTFDLALSVVASPAVNHHPTTEPRQGPAQTIVMTFDGIISAATVNITEGTATAGVPVFSGSDVIIGLTGVVDRQYVTVSLTNIASTDGRTGGSASVRVGFLVGDVSGNRVVSLADVALVNAQLAMPATAANFLKDVNASGTVSLADKAITNANLTKSLPAP